MDVMTEYGVTREIHLTAAKRLFDDAVRRVMEKKVAVQHTKRLEKISPAAAALLKDWIKQWNDSSRGLTTEEVPDTDEEFDSSSSEPSTVNR